MYQILKALDYANSKGIMHRDLKPDNIAIDHPNRKLKILDLGLSGFYRPGHNYKSNARAKHYFNPELRFDKKFYNYAVDIWSLGHIFAEMLF